MPDTLLLILLVVAGVGSGIFFNDLTRSGFWLNTITGILVSLLGGLLAAHFLELDTSVFNLPTALFGSASAVLTLFVINIFVRR